MTKKPASGDVVAFLVERSYNVEIVRQTLLERVLMDQYDRISYIIDGKYHDLISNMGKKERLLLPDEAGETYEEVYLNYLLPTMQWNTADGPNPMRPSVIDKALAERDTYHVNAPFILDGELRHKHIIFYVIDRKAKYYLMLITDATAVQEEQSERNRELQDALEDAMRSNEARTRFFTNVSHDLRTPMNGILGFTKMAREEQDPVKRREYLDRVELSGNQLLGQMDDLLAMSLIYSGKLDLREEPLDLEQAAASIREMGCMEADQKNVAIRVDTSGLRERRVLGDELRLTQVMRRLLNNACHYTPAGGEVSLSLSQTGDTDPAPGTYVLSIRSTGQPIPEDVLDRIFQKSAWEKSTALNALPGVGLGMTVTKAYIDAMHGDVTVANTPEGGAEFVIRLPLVSLPPEDEAPQPDRAYSVLLVDDNEINREIGELMLTGAAFTVDLAENGAEALEKLSGAAPGAYDAVLMDIQMPVMNGYEATAAIRALEDPEKARIPIIALTANAYQEDMSAALKAGMDGYATKPLVPEKIVAELAKAMKK